MSMTIALYPGTFDPLTYGHINIIERAAKLFEHLIVAIAENPKKKPLFSLEERMSLTKEALLHCPHVSVKSFQGLLVDFARQENAYTIVRGLRAVPDFEFELQLAQMNQALEPKLETIFIPTTNHLSYISSTLLREIAELRGKVHDFVPPPIEKALAAKYPPCCT